MTMSDTDTSFEKTYADAWAASLAREESRQKVARSQKPIRFYKEKIAICKLMADRRIRTIDDIANAIGVKSAGRNTLTSALRSLQARGIIVSEWDTNNLMRFWVAK
jgi:hypothetical protein